MIFSISSAKDGGVVLVMAAGDLDIATADDLWSHLSGWIQQGEQQIVIDCAELSFLDCSGIGALVRCLKVVSPIGGRIRLRHANRRVRLPLTITGLADVFLDEDETPGGPPSRLRLTGAPSKPRPAVGGSMDDPEVLAAETA
jgi:anti-sigma B factor antagonist